MLTQARLKQVLSYDAETGVFVWVKCLNNRYQGKMIAGNPMPRGYIQVGIDNKRYLAHRLAWLYVTGEWPKQGIDHINGNTADNRFANLRDVSQTENMHNIRGLVKKNKTGYVGVFFDRIAKKYRSYITLHGKSNYLGTFDTAEDAAKAYLAAKPKYHPTSPVAQ